MNYQEVIIQAFKQEVGVYVKAYGISNTVKQCGHTGPFAYIPKDVDLVELLEELFKDEIIKNQSAKRWINVNEKLPEKNTYVLMSTTSGHVCTTFYTEPTNRLIDCKISAWFEHANKFHYEVTHWQPLPKAPEKWI